MSLHSHTFKLTLFGGGELGVRRQNMNTILPVIVVLSLGVGSGLILRRWLKNIWITSIAAGISGTIMWGVIMEILFHMVDFEKERGGVIWQAIFMVALVASIASFVALSLRNLLNKDTNKGMQETASTARVS
jgi:hypothetical protein